MKKLFLLFFSVLFLPSYASHIVGGEFELLHLQGKQYRLNLIYYFDTFSKNFIGTTPEASEPTLTAYIFRKSDDFRMRAVTLSFLSPRTRVGYTQPDCSNGEIVTDKLIYTAVIELPVSDYSDPAGYYVSWERCCRNYTIANIYSDDPQIGGIRKSAGQTFYLEFPPVVKNGIEFINSSPHLFPPLNDYACIGRSYYVDFAGVDDDGDSVVYSLTTPLTTDTNDPLPPPSPQPYPLIEWKPGYSLTSILKGNPDLKITRNGLLTGTPSQEGLYVFAVKIEEFRNKEKIGETRRDFQMLVVDCQAAVAPVIVGKKLTDNTFSYQNDMSVTFNNTVNDSDRCIQVQVSDADSQKPESGFSENIKIRVVGLNFKDPRLNEILPAEVSATLINGSTKDFRICFPVCPFLSGGPYQVGIIAMDDACSLPMLDTLKVTVYVEPPLNKDPYFVQPVTNVVAQLSEGTQGTWDFEVRDDDGDELTLFVGTDGFKMEDAGMRIDTISHQSGLFKGRLVWDAFCDVYNFTKRTSFNVKISANDNDQCNLNAPVSATYNLSVILPGNADPIVYTGLAPPSLKKIVGLERKINQSFSFDVTGSDLVDNDNVSLIMETDNFNALDYGISFSDKTGVGIVQSPFQWDLRCNKINLARKDVFNFTFVAIDSTNKCRIRKTDTVRVEVKILPPDNTNPLLTVTNKNPEVIFSSNQVEAIRGHQIILSLDGTDPDFFPRKDSLTLELVDTKDFPVPAGIVFANASGFGSVSSTFSWNPDCTIFQNGVYENNYSLFFYLKDNKCLNAKKDSAIVKIKIKDIEAREETFIPPNVFTPNGDDLNDYYAMAIRNETTGELTNILPADNCAGHFERVRIFNRWGTQVFESTDRDFRWLGKEEAAGVYYYEIKYSNREYKGTVSLRY